MSVFNISYLDTAAKEVKDAIIALPGEIVTDFNSLRVLTVVTKASVKKIRAIPGVLGVEVDGIVNVEAQYSWHQQRIASASMPMRSLYAPASHGAGAEAYLVDSGVNTAHAEFNTAAITELWKAPEFEDFSDATGHGTAIASLIVGSTLGVSPRAMLHVVKIPQGATQISILLAAFDAILADHRETPNVAKVVNCSWVITKSMILDAKIAELESENLIVVAAAGNQGLAADNYSPVGLDSVLGVGASDEYDRVMPWASGSSNFGPEVDVHAPGVGVMVADSASGMYKLVSGTSFAAGVATGVVLQYLSMVPALTAETVQQMVIGECKVDQLFWDEAVYGTTPNLIVYSYSEGYTPFWQTPQNTVIWAKAGETTTFPVETFNPDMVVTLPMDYVAKRDSILVLPPNWITMVNEELRITPPSDMGLEKHMVFVKGTDSAGNVMYNRLVIGVFDTTLGEAQVVENVPEQYTTVNTSGQVVVIPSACAQICGDKGLICVSPCSDCVGQGGPGFECGPDA